MVAATPAVVKNEEGLDVVKYKLGNQTSTSVFRGHRRTHDCCITYVGGACRYFLVLERRARELKPSIRPLSATNSQTQREKEYARHPNIVLLLACIQRRLDWQLPISKFTRQPRMPRVRDRVVVPDHGRGLCAFLDAPEGPVFVHGRDDEERAVLFDVFFRELLVNVDWVGVVVWEVSLDKRKSAKGRRDQQDEEAQEISLYHSSLSPAVRQAVMDLTERFICVVI